VPNERLIRKFSTSSLLTYTLRSITIRFYNKVSCVYFFIYLHT